MKEFDRAIAYTIRRYPSLYESRSSVLHHWFCSIGNGMVWVEGKLLRGYVENPKEIEQEKDIDLNIEPWEMLGDIQWNLRLAKEKMIRENADLIAILPSNISQPLIWIYPMCKEYSPLACFPKKIHQEYLQGILEMIEIVFSVDVSDGYDIAQKLNNIDVAEFALNRVREDIDVPYSSYNEWQKNQEKARNFLRSKILHESKVSR
jgi:Asp-tRNA(Asn)/Glu-tRNA(Gln) amidotransferase C subunit